MIRVRPSRPEEKERLKELWQAVFGDGDQYIETFFSCCYQAERFLVLTEDDVICSMLTLLPVTLTCENGAQSHGSYLYALATDPACRGKGYAKRLVRYTHQYAREQGVECMVVVPAEPSLHTFFGELDFQLAFSTRVTMVERAKIRQPDEEDAIAPVDVEEYMTLRTTCLERVQRVDYPEELIRYQKEVGELGGGGLYKLTIAEEEGCAAVECVDGQAFIKELLVAPRDVKGALALLSQQLPKITQFQVRTPAQWKGTADSVVQPFGMLRWYNLDAANQWTPVEDSYMGLAFD